MVPSHTVSARWKVIFTIVTVWKSKTPNLGLGSCPQPPQYIYIFHRLLLSKRQWCMMGIQSADPLRTFPLHSGAYFDVCCSKHGQISPIHHLLRDEAQHKSTNEHIRRKPRQGKRSSCKWKCLLCCLWPGWSVCRTVPFYILVHMVHALFTMAAFIQ